MKRRGEPLSPPRFPDKRAALLLFACTLLVRLICLFGGVDRTWPHSIYYEGDAPRWADWAEALAHGEPYQFDLPIWSPAVAYLLHAAAALGFDGFLAMKVAWCVLSAASVALVFLAFRREFPTGASLAAALLCLAHFSQYQLATSLNNELPYLLLIVAIVLLTLSPPSWSRSASLGALHGLATLVRPEHLLLLLVLAARDVAVERRAAPGPRLRAWLLAARRPAVLFGAALLVCLPWSIHATRATAAYNRTAVVAADYASAAVPLTAQARAFFDSLPPFCRGQNLAFVCHIAGQRGLSELDAAAARQILLEAFGALPEPLRTPVFVSSQGPLSFALANHPAAEGGFSLAALDERMSDPGGLNLAIPSHLRLYNHGFAAGWGYVAQHPDAALQNFALKFLRFARGAAPAFSSLRIPFGRDGVRAAVDLTTPVGWAAASLTLVFLALAAVGARRALRAGPGRVWLLIVAYKLVVTALFYGYARQAASIYPALAILAALGAAALLPRPPLRAARRLCGALLAGALLLVIAADVYVATTRPLIEVIGPAEAAPQYGAEAWTAPSEIRLLHHPRR